MSEAGNRPPEATTKAAILARLDKYNVKTPAERTELSDLPQWVKTAAVYKEIMGASWEEAASRFKRKGSTLEKYNRSPAYQKWRESLRDVAEDPKMMAEAVLKSSALGVTVEVFAAFQAAIDANDYKETGVIGRDLLDRIGVTKKSDKNVAQAQTIVVNLGSNSLEIPLGDSRVQSVEEGDFEVVE